MDAQKFDDLIRRLATERLTRLTALRGIVAGAAAAMTGANLGLDETEAKKANGGKKDKDGKKDKGGKASKDSKKAKKADGGKKDKDGKKVKKADGSQGQEKVTICHKGKTIEVARPAVQTHTKHGD